MENEKNKEQDQEQNQDQEQDTQTKSQSNSGSAFYKQKLTALQEENLNLSKKLETIQTTQLEEKENFKQLWDLEKQKRIEAEEKNKTLSQTVFNNFKMSAIKEEALKAGILPEAIDDLDTVDSSLVEIETTDRGTINVIGAQDFIEQFKGRKPHWFKRINAPIINNGNPGEIPETKLTPKDIIKLQKENPSKYNEYMRKRLGKK